MDRRNFIRGTLLTAPALMLGGPMADLVGGDTAVALLTPPGAGDRPPEPHDADPVAHIVERLAARIHHHIAIFNEAPKALFVNRYEMRALYFALEPHNRWSSGKVQTTGYDNLLVKGVPVICVESDVIYLDVGHDPQ